jgi:Cytochrome P460
MIVVQTHAAKLDSQQKPVVGRDGLFVAEKIEGYAAMASGSGWGRNIPEPIRNDNWNYAIFSSEKVMRTGINQAECLACHVPVAKDSYVFTLKQLAAMK